MTCEFTAKQITDALIDAFRDDEPDELKESLAKLLAIHYPEDFLKFQAVLEASRYLRGAS
jgi:hypothetical protein